MHLTTPFRHVIDRHRRSTLRILFFVLLIWCMSDQMARAQNVAIQPMIISETLAPGDVGRAKLTIHNYREASVVAKVTVVGLAKNDQDRWVVLDGAMPDSTETGLEFGKPCEPWISLIKQSQNDIEIEARQTSVLEVGIEVPADAEGTYWTGIKVGFPPEHANHGVAVRYDFVVPVLLEVRASQPRETGILDASEILARWEAAYGQIISLRTEYTETDYELDTGSIAWQRVWKRIQDGRHEYAREEISIADGKPADTFREWSFDGKVLRSYKSFPNQASIQSGSMYYKIWNQVTNLMFLERHYRDDRFPDGIPSFSHEVRNALEYGTIHVRPGLESVLGEPCHVLEIEKKNGQGFVFWLAHNRDCLIMKHQCFRGEKMTYSIEVKSLANSVCDTGIVWYPGELAWEQSEPKSKKMLRLHTFVPHTKVPVDTFAFQFPAGATVIDRIADTHYVMGESQSKR